MPSQMTLKAPNGHTATLKDGVYATKAVRYESQSGHTKGLFYYKWYTARVDENSWKEHISWEMAKPIIVGSLLLVIKYNWSHHVLAAV